MFGNQSPSGIPASVAWWLLYAVLVYRLARGW